MQPFVESVISEELQMELIGRYLSLLGIPYDFDDLFRLAKQKPYETLALLQASQLKVLPYTNERLYHRRGPPASTEEILRQTIIRGKGGLCLELNYTFKFILECLGYKAKLILCQQLTKEVRSLQKQFTGDFIKLTEPEQVLETYFTPRDAHSALIVNDRWFCDLGFGEFFIRPLPITDSVDLIDGLKIIPGTGYHYLYNKERGVFLRSNMKEATIEEFFDSLDWYNPDPNSLWAIWTNRLYESHLKETSEGLKYEVVITTKNNTDNKSIRSKL